MTATNIIDIVIVGGSALGLAVLTYLAVTGGKGYSVQDTQAHASDYAGQMKEGHGGMTALLWVSFVAVLLWAVYYLVRHAGEFGQMGGQ
jgi:hypothetical protein